MWPRPCDPLSLSVSHSGACLHRYRMEDTQYLITTYDKHTLYSEQRFAAIALCLCIFWLFCGQIASHCDHSAWINVHFVSVFWCFVFLFSHFQILYRLLKSSRPFLSSPSMNLRCCKHACGSQTHKRAHKVTQIKLWLELHTLLLFVGQRFMWHWSHARLSLHCEALKSKSSWCITNVNPPHSQC